MAMPVGSLTLKGDVAYYSRAVKTGSWHQERQSEPKDFILSTADVRNLHLSTYRRMGPLDEPPGSTTYQDQCSQVLNQPSGPSTASKAMITLDCVDNPLLNPSTGNVFSIPRHKIGYDRHQLETTNRADFKPPYPYEPKEVSFAVADHSASYKRPISQFTDTTDYRRPGRNTWMDESGVYANSHLRRQMETGENPLVPRSMTQE